jgi:membrane protease YdiL (CAAX protease family)
MKHTLTVTPSKQELIWGMSYLAAQLLVMPTFLGLISTLLHLTAAQLNGIYFAVNFIAVVLIFRKFLVAQLRSCLRRIGALLGWALLGFLLYMVTNYATGTAIMLLDPDFANVNDSAIAAMAVSDYWIMALGTVVLVPLTEELLYRGILFAGLYNHSPVVAYAVSAAVFSAVHIVGYIGLYPVRTLLLCLLQYITPSLCLCWVYARSNSIFTPILIHTAINAIGILAMR